MTMYKFEAKISNFEVCLTTDYIDWHILPTKLIDDIASGIRDGKCYTILGPPRCQKSFLLKSISSKLQKWRKVSRFKLVAKLISLTLLIFGDIF